MASAELLAAAEALAETAAGDGFTTRQEAEAGIGAARELVQAAIDLVQEELGTTGWPQVVALRRLAASLLDLVTATDDALATREITLASERSVIDLALELYGDGLRATDLLALNPSLPNPHRVPSGTVLVAYVR